MGNQCFKSAEAEPPPVSNSLSDAKAFQATVKFQPSAKPESVYGLPQTEQSIPSNPVSQASWQDQVLCAGVIATSYTAGGPPSGLSSKNQTHGSGNTINTINTTITMVSNNFMAQPLAPDIVDSAGVDNLQAIRNSDSSVLGTNIQPPKGSAYVNGRQNESSNNTFSFLQNRAYSNSLRPTSIGDSQVLDSAAPKHERMHSSAQLSECGIPSATILTSNNSAFLGHMPDLVTGSGEDVKLIQLSVRELNDEIQDLTFIGQGAGGDVYRGQWQGATVAVKYIISQNDGAVEAASKEAVLGRLLAHPNVVQTFSCKVVRLDDNFFSELHDLVVAHHRQQAEAAAAAAAAASETQGLYPTMQIGTGRQLPPHGDMDGPAMVANSFMSGEGFGNPLTRPPNVVALQEVLVRANAKPGHMLTQIVMDHCDKGSLQQAIKRGLFRPTSKWGCRLALRALLRTAREVAQGMWHIHSSNVIHGDLKPGNVLLKGSRADRRGFVAKVSDFGLARMSDRTAVDKDQWGTVEYMSPEAFDGTVTKDVDVWAFGVTLWQMVAGEAPYSGLHPGQIMVGVQSGTLTLDWPQDTHPRLLRLGLACLEHDRKRRPNFQHIMKELSLIESIVRLEGSKEGSSSTDRIMTTPGSNSGRSPAPPSNQSQGLVVPPLGSVRPGGAGGGPSSVINSSCSLSLGIAPLGSTSIGPVSITHAQPTSSGSGCTSQPTSTSLTPIKDSSTFSLATPVSLRWPTPNNFDSLERKLGDGAAGTQVRALGPLPIFDVEGGGLSSKDGPVPMGATAVPQSGSASGSCAPNMGGRESGGSDGGGSSTTAAGVVAQVVVGAGRGQVGAGEGSKISEQHA